MLVKNFVIDSETNIRMSKTFKQKRNRDLFS